jgi:fatty-acyl-CoA synthase
MSETCGLGTINPPDRIKLGTVGPPTPGIEIRLDEDGEVLVKADCVMPGYRNLPEKNDETFTDDGWLRTGDVATMDARGRIKLVDRTKDLIKSGGEWISSVELENELMGHPQIREAAVIGIPDEKWSERPLACVVLEEGVELTESQVLEFLAPKVARWQLPDHVVFIDEVPKTSVGKFSKKTLRERFAGGVRG